MDPQNEHDFDLRLKCVAGLRRLDDRAELFFFAMTEALHAVQPQTMDATYTYTQRMFCFGLRGCRVALIALN